MSVECLIMGNLGLPAAAGSMTMITCNMPDHSSLPSHVSHIHLVWRVCGRSSTDCRYVGLTSSILQNNPRRNKSLHMSAVSLAAGHLQVRNRTDLVFY